MNNLNSRTTAFLKCLKLKNLLTLVFLVVFLNSPYLLASEKQLHNQMETAQTPYNYSISPPVDLSILLVSGSMWLLTAILNSNISSDRCFNTCDPLNINSFDRPASNFHYSQFRLAADLTIVGTMTLALSATILQHKSIKNINLWTDLLIMAQTVTINGLLGEIIKNAIQRPRPYMYNVDAPYEYRRNNKGDLLAFYSGHTATTAALCFALATIISSNTEKKSFKIMSFLTAFMITSAAGVFRVLSGDHFPTDVIVGGFAGATLGITIPLLHKNLPSQSNSELKPSLALAGTFVLMNF